MTQQSSLLIKTLEKIGTPLAIAVEEVSQRTRGDMEASNREIEDSKIIAQLLGQTVQVSLSLGGSLIQASDEADADALRLAVAAMVAPIIAHNYRQNGTVPDDHALGRITKSLEATLAFAENFNPASDQGSRISMLGEDTLIFDENQVDITVIDALVPAINAIGEFSFGLSETKLLQEVSDKLKEKAQKLNSSSDSLTELITLKSLAKIYAECHLSQVRKLSNSSDEGNVELSIDPVWQEFDTRLAMVSAVLGLSPLEVSSGGSVSPVMSTTNNEPQQSVQTPPTTAATTVQPENSASGGGPMSFFSGGDKKPDVAPSEQPTVAPSQSAEPQAEIVTASTEESVGNNSGDSSSPMSFFKPGAKKDENESVS